jgi:hypothetical protein
MTTIDNDWRELRTLAREDRVLYMQLLQDLVCTDNCWNYPAKVELPAGTVLHTTNTESTNSGDFFFKVAGIPGRGNKQPHYGKNVTLPFSAFKTRHPYDQGWYNPQMVRHVTLAELQDFENAERAAFELSVRDHAMQVSLARNPEQPDVYEEGYANAMWLLWQSRALMDRDAIPARLRIAHLESQLAEAQQRQPDKVDVVLEMPQDDPRAVRIVYRDMRAGKIHLCITVDTPPPMPTVGTAVALPGSGEGFTMCVFKATDVPIGTELHVEASPAARS